MKLLVHRRSFYIWQIIVHLDKWTINCLKAQHSFCNLVLDATLPRCIVNLDCTFKSTFVLTYKNANMRKFWMLFKLEKIAWRNLILHYYFRIFFPVLFWPGVSNKCLLERPSIIFSQAFMVFLLYLRNTQFIALRSPFMIFVFLLVLLPFIF